MTNLAKIYKFSNCVKPLCDGSNYNLQYTSFGSVMQGREFTALASSTGGYKYGFNGKENLDNSNSELDFGNRIYLSALGRWMTVDPEFGMQPSQSTFKFALNNPIFYIDPEGKTEYVSITIENKTTGVILVIDFEIPNRIMADQGETCTGIGESSTYQCYKYYDFKRTIKIVIGENDVFIDEPTKLLKENGVKDEEGAPFITTEPSKGHVKFDYWGAATDIIGGDFTGSGGQVKGGFNLITKSDGGLSGASPTRFTAGTWDPVEVDLLLSLFGSVNTSLTDLRVFSAKFKSKVKVANEQAELFTRLLTKGSYEGNDLSKLGKDINAVTKMAGALDNNGVDLFDFFGSKTQTTESQENNNQENDQSCYLNLCGQDGCPRSNAVLLQQNPNISHQKNCPIPKSFNKVKIPCKNAP